MAKMFLALDFSFRCCTLSKLGVGYFSGRQVIKTQVIVLPIQKVNSNPNPKLTLGLKISVEA